MFFKYNFWGLAWALLIFFLCGLPGGEFPDLSFWSMLAFEKVAHAFVFAVLVVLLIVGFIKQFSFPALRYMAVPIAPIISIIYGGAIELLQLFLFEERSADVLDFIANSAGAGLGVIAFYMIYGKYNYVK